MAIDMLDRFVAKINWPSTLVSCWIWNACTDRNGYGTFYVDRRHRSSYAHRLAFEFARGPIPTGLVLDHLCRVPLCVNPLHLEPVTDAVNIMRGEGISRVNSEKTQCIHGHPFNSANTYLSGGRRHCRSCNRRRVAARRSRLGGLS